MRPLQHAVVALVLVSAVVWWAGTVVSSAAGISAELDQLTSEDTGMIEWWHDPDGDGPLQPFPLRTHARDYGSTAEWIQATQDLQAVFPPNASAPGG